MNIYDFKNETGWYKSNSLRSKLSLVLAEAPDNTPNLSREAFTAKFKALSEFFLARLDWDISKAFDGLISELLSSISKIL